MVFIGCSEKCIHQTDGMCTLDHVSTLTNTSPVGCEYYVEKGKENDTPELILRGEIL